ncbi:hypothetical protein N6H14_26780 [Paenibacillus sp. CC-CFT747]|nr:hypothetical protein N6H14_26780 [Paenibacillus sp. CC-CFT747]
MADETKRTGGEPVFDTDRAWHRFERLAAGEPVPTVWKQEHFNKDGDRSMKKANFTPFTPEFPVDAAAKTSYSGSSVRMSTWRTEKPVKRQIRRLAVGAAASVLVIGLFTTTLGDRALAAMQQTFRIQHVVGVEISADDMTAISSLIDRGSPDGDRRFDLAQYGTLTQLGGGKAHTVTWSEAQQGIGSSLLQLEDSTDPLYQPGTTLTFNLKVKAVNRLLTRLGSATNLPAEADGKALRLNIPDGISTEGTLAGKPVRLLQFGKPELNVDDGIDAAAVREAVLGLPVLPDSLRTKLAAIGDWKNTLPIPARGGVTKNLSLRGHDAVMTVNGSTRYLLWVDGNRINLLSGDTKVFSTESDMRQAAEELIRP